MVVPFLRNLQRSISLCTSRRSIVSDAEQLESQQAFKGRVFSVDRDRVKMPNGRTVTVDVVRHSRSVVLVPVPEPGKVILIRQYRYAVNAFLWELPAGSVDEGESPEQAARRECHEEIGLVPSTIVRLSAMYPTPGYCDEEMVFFRLSGLEKTDEQAAVDEDEDIEAKVFELRDAREMIRRGEIQDMKTLVGLTLI
jgi:ADP-ribose pyrophosphatase